MLRKTASKIFFGLPFFLLLLSLSPIAVLVKKSFFTNDVAWEHLKNHSLTSEIIPNTIFLIFWVVFWSILIAIPCAWIVSRCGFWGRRFFNTALILPMAIPAYVLAFIYKNFFSFNGFWFSLTGQYKDIFYHNPVTIGFILSLSLYPYLYLFLRNAFQSQTVRLLEASQSLGISAQNSFFKIILPISWPWLAVGCLLIILETLSDFGAVAIFNYNTFTTSIYKALFDLYSISSAAKLSLILVTFCFIVMFGEKFIRQKKNFNQNKSASKDVSLISLSPAKKTLCFCFCSLIVLISFLIPIMTLISWALQSKYIVHDILPIIYKTFTLAMIGAIVLTIFSLVLYLNSSWASKKSSLLIRLSMLGYALPGTILAVALIPPISYLIKISTKISSISNIAVFITLALLIFAYLIRFLLVGYQAIATQAKRFNKNLLESSTTLGAGRYETIKKIQLPLIKPGILIAFCLCFVDISKEMPITLMLRPFGWDTLAVKIFELTNDGLWKECAIPALLIISLGLIPVYISSQLSLTAGKEH